jgi:hypothetical protein
MANLIFWRREVTFFPTKHHRRNAAILTSSRRSLGLMIHVFVNRTAGQAPLI